MNTALAEIFRYNRWANRELFGKKPAEIKAQQLTRLAAASLTAESYAKGTDAIRYLADTITNGIETALTPCYRMTILALAGDAPDLATARMRMAHERELGALEGEPPGASSPASSAPRQCSDAA